MNLGGFTGSSVNKIKQLSQFKKWYVLVYTGIDGV